MASTLFLAYDSASLSRLLAMVCDTEPLWLLVTRVCLSAASFLSLASAALYMDCAFSRIFAVWSGILVVMVLRMAESAMEAYIPVGNSCLSFSRASIFLAGSVIFEA